MRRSKNEKTAGITIHIPAHLLCGKVNDTLLRMARMLKNRVKKNPTKPWPIKRKSKTIIHGIQYDP